MPYGIIYKKSQKATKKSQKTAKEIECKHLYNAIEGLFLGFTWSESEEGFNYWSNIVSILMKKHEKLLKELKND